MTDLVRHFGSDAPVRRTDPGQADEFRTHGPTRSPKLSAATVARRRKAARVLFDHARRSGLIDANPFADIPAKGAVPKERRRSIPAADIERGLAVCDPRWRVIVAPSRFAGLRCPPEVPSLKWEHVNWEDGRFTVPS